MSSTSRFAHAPPPSRGRHVIDADGIRGVAGAAVASTPGGRDAHVIVALDSGRDVELPAHVLVPSSDGGLTYRGRFAELPASARPATGRGPGDDGRGEARHSQAPARHIADDELVVPVVEEELHVGTREVEQVDLRITKTVAERVETVDIPLLEEHLDVERVIVNRMVDVAPPVRYEGDVMIVPLVDEVLVTETRLMLREELRIRKSAAVVHRPQPVTLRREEAQVERVDHDDDRR